MKNLKKFNEEIGDPNWSNNVNNKNILRVTIEMSDETAKELEGYFDCNSAESAISEHLSSLNELEGVDIKIKFN